MITMLYLNLDNTDRVITTERMNSKGRTVHPIHIYVITLL